MAALTREALIGRLESYWRMELASVLLIPGVCFLFCMIADAEISRWSLVSLFVMSLLLTIGAGYWRAKVLQMRGDQKPLARVLSYARWLEWPLLVVVVGLVAMCVVDATSEPLLSSKAERVITWIASTLAALEYANYYRIQLQHFDHRPDFDRLMAGRGFRRSRMRVDLDRYRRGLFG